MNTDRNSGRHDVRVGQVYVDVKPPRREWRVHEEKDGLFTLVRTDDARVIRCLEADALLDDTRYRRIS